jgi:uncharacterized protein
VTENRIPFFGKTRAVERQIDEFLDSVSEVGILFVESVREYVRHGVDEDCLRRQLRIGEVERHCDDLRRSIESVLLTQMLIPESRGDVLQLIDLLDDLLDDMKRELLNVTIEMPRVTEELVPDVERLLSSIALAIDQTVRAARAYFIDQRGVRNHVHKIGVYESEADAVAIRLKQTIFSSNRELAEKMMLRDFIDSLDRLADEAEDLGDQLSIFTLRRSL